MDSSGRDPDCTTERMQTERPSTSPDAGLPESSVSASGSEIQEKTFVTLHA